MENERRLPDLRLPVRVLWGTDDAWLPLEVGARLHRLVPGAQWREADGAGQLLQVDAPVALSHELTTWLAAQTA
ncbi:alpha/beta fold hydrolase [Pseudokineococcus sp. 1T1Z-3]|uniref:alpha/beta fold hydrolase n=1 Tax=Pseudokineococcus sp. 1T1Z-3 TaxID=3132745 RepID=UPI0030AE3EDE